MFPDHCSKVSLKIVSFLLTEEDIQKNFLNKPVYKKTEFIILNNSDGWAVIRIRKKDEKGLFARIEEAEVISLPETTRYMEDDSVDVLSPSRMAEKAEELGAKTLITKGKFEHISFIHNEKPVHLTVFEVVPPEPPKLVELVRNALYSGNVNKAVKMIPKILNLCQLAKEFKNQNIMFPCHASGLTSEKKTFYLDQKPEFTQEEKSNISLIGCDLSLRIFKTLYGEEPEFFNFCPKNQVTDSKLDAYAITKCCEVKEGHERVGNTVIVPWGATQKEVEDALNEIFR